ncbi:hypothetical protein H9654_05205 [Stenotrophomonas sp. Sa5BUN4]|uniref:Uncharacterized protein n=1 Tax=Stenotrophomonas lacuserhaii TaxID=2760084 RepID=A0A8X8FTP8_9GAMM|nr:hypothetical protein [Stenotrophomonas pennii]MBD7953601.1 hypothetical protein [Stenotrophomonas pennii]
MPASSSPDFQGRFLPNAAWRSRDVSNRMYVQDLLRETLGEEALEALSAEGRYRRDVY